MTALVLDAGALIALDRNERAMWALLRVASDDDDIVAVPAGVIGQAWRDGARQALLARALSHCHEVSLDGANARAAGQLCAQTATADVIDASVAIAAAGMGLTDDVAIVTSDPTDIAQLVAALNIEVAIVSV